MTIKQTSKPVSFATIAAPHVRALVLGAFALAVLAPLPAAAADVLLSGTITSAAGEKMDGVTVSAKEVGKTITTTVFTDETGAYVFPPLADGQYKVWAQAIGYETAKSDIALGEAKKQNLTLAPITDTERRIEQLPGDLILAGLPGDTPDDLRMKQIFRNNCTSCHTPSYTLQHRFDEAGWNAVITTMKSVNVYGFYYPKAEINPVLDFHQAELAKYLAKARGPDESGFRITTRPRPSGEAARVVFREYDVPLNPDQDLPATPPPNNGSDWTMGTPSRIGSLPHDAAADLDGNLWFAVVALTKRGSVGRIDAKTGEVTFFKVAAQNGNAANAHGLIRDAKGKIWFNVWMPRGGIASIDPKTEKIDVFLPPPGISAIDGPVTIDYDGEGQIWATTNQGALRLDPESGRFTEYKSVTPTTANGGKGSSYGIAGTADGNAWWTEMAFDTIERSDIKTGQSTEWKLPPVAEQAKLVNDDDRKFYSTYAPKDIGTPFPWSQGPRRIGIDRETGVIWAADSWGGNLLRIDTKSADMKFIPFPNPESNMPYHATPDKDHNVWASLWTTDQIAKYEPATGKWTMFDLPTRGTEVRIISLLEKPSAKELVFAYARSSKVAVMTFRGEAEVEAAEAAAARQ
jgi:streptogramin lyase